MGARGPKKGQFGKIPAEEMNKNSMANLRPINETWEGPTQEQWDDLLARMASGENATRIVDAEWEVTWNTFWRWRNENGKQEEFEQAIRARVESMQFEILDIADDQESDVYKDEDGKEITNHNVIQRAKLRVDTRFKVMQSLDARFKPKSELDVTSKGEQIAQPMDEEAILIASEVIRKKRENDALSSQAD